MCLQEQLLKGGTGMDGHGRNHHGLTRQSNGYFDWQTQVKQIGSCITNSHLNLFALQVTSSSDITIIPAPDTSQYGMSQVGQCGYYS